jgi:hypothetical protein
VFFSRRKVLKRQPFFFDRLMNQGVVPFLLLNLVTVASLRMALDLTELTLMGKLLTGRLRGRTLLSEEEKPTLLAKSLMMLMTLFIRYVQHFVKKCTVPYRLFLLSAYEIYGSVSLNNSDILCKQICCRRAILFNNLYREFLFISNFRMEVEQVPSLLEAVLSLPEAASFPQDRHRRMLFSKY